MSTRPKRIDYLKKSSKRFVKAGNDITCNPLVKFKEYYDALELLLKALYLSTCPNHEGTRKDDFFTTHNLSKIYKKIIESTKLELISEENLDRLKKYGNIHITVPYGGNGSVKEPNITEQDIQFIHDLIENLKKSYKKIKKTVKKKKDKKLKLNDINYKDYDNEWWDRFSSEEDYDF